MKERTEKFIELTHRMIEIQAAKGHDYGESDDGLHNLRKRGVDGILARMGDKLSRIETLIKPGIAARVSDEALEDTLLDLANYSLLLILLRNDLRKENEISG